MNLKETLILTCYFYLNLKFLRSTKTDPNPAVIAAGPIAVSNATNSSATTNDVEMPTTAAASLELLLPPGVELNGKHLMPPVLQLHDSTLDAEQTIRQISFVSVQSSEVDPCVGAGVAN